MYTSVIDYKKAAFIYLTVSLFCMAFGAVYELFSHEVYSGFMIYAFAIPLVGGALPCCGCSLFRKSPVIGRAAFNLWNSALAAFTVGSFVKGILDIYGTTNRLTAVYFAAGVVFTVFSAAAQLISRIKARA